MIRTPPATDAYRDAWDRVFGDVNRDEEPAPLSGAKMGDPNEAADVIAEVAENMRRVGGQPDSTDGIHCRIRTWVWHCKTCDALISDPENHQYHAVVAAEVP